jgi:predicted RNA-binding protein with TRAM domain
MDGIGCPVEEGKEYDVTIDAKGSKGDGIAHVEGFVIFVAGGNVGEKVKIKVTAVKRTFAIGEKV